MNISIITTVNHNVGDDFVREGIIHVLTQKLKGHKLNFENIHKHSPVTAVYGRENLRNIRVSRLVEPLSTSGSCLVSHRPEGASNALLAAGLAWSQTKLRLRRDRL